MTPPSEFTQKPNKPFDVGVVGGGIGGLILTLALLKQQVPVTLYEAAAKFGEIGAGVSFGPNAIRAMRLISPHIEQAFENRNTRNQWEEKRHLWFDFRYGETCDGKQEVGKIITGLPCEGGQASVHRAHFLDELVNLLPEGTAKFGKRAIGYRDEGDQGVEIHFADGTTARHDAVIGCDGIKSKLRPALLGQDHSAAKAVYSGKYAYRGLIPMDKARSLLGDELAMNSQQYLGRHRHVLTFGVEKGNTMNVVAFASSDSWDKDEWVTTMKREEMIADFADWSQSVKDILSLMTKTDVWALFNHPAAPTYYKGRVALLGDAAHASTPHCGAGAGMAVEDAYILSSLLGEAARKEDLEKVFAAYDAVRRPRTTRLVEHSRRQGQLYEGELVGTELPALKKELDQSLKWIWEYDINVDLARAQDLAKNGANGSS